MSNNLASELTVTGSDQLIVIGVAVIALVALAVAFVLRASVLAADQGTPKMQAISEAVQEGAAAYLGRQFRTLAVFVVVVFLLLFVLPADTQSERIGRSIFFLLGALFSATIGYVGMWLATRSPADSFNAPVGSPFASRTIFPFGGSAVSFVIPAIASALLFAHELWPSKATRYTGRSGTTSSSIFLFGSAEGPNVG